VKWKCLSRKLQKSRKCSVFFLRLQRFLGEAVFGEMEMSLAEAAEIAEMFCFLSAPSALSAGTLLTLYQKMPKNFFFL
jgi:hypothetical protein